MIPAGPDVKALRIEEARRRLWQRRLRVVGWQEDGPRYEVDYTVNITGDQEGRKDEL